MIDLDTELVALLQGQQPGRRWPRARRRVAAPLAFVSTDGSITIEIAFEHDAVTGQLIGADAAVISLEHTSGASVDAPLGALGRFRFTGLAPGPARVRVRVVDTTVATEWFVL